jgi:hypothetical protein
MTITLELTPEEAELLREAAAAEGTDAASYIRHLVFATALNAPLPAAGKGAPHTYWQNGRPVYHRPEPPEWLQQQLQDSAEDETKTLRRVIGQWPGDETDAEIADALNAYRDSSAAFLN